MKNVTANNYQNVKLYPVVCRPAIENNDCSAPYGLVREAYVRPRCSTMARLTSRGSSWLRAR